MRIYGYLQLVFLLSTVSFIYWNFYQKGGSQIIDHIEHLQFHKGFPTEFLPNFKNPCWYERDANYSGSDKVLKCLPFFFLIGQPKCGTTDLYMRITAHPDVESARYKGLHWWSRTRFKGDLRDKNNTVTTFGEYVNMFSRVSRRIEVGSRLYYENSMEYNSSVITGDGSSSTMFDGHDTIQELKEIQSKYGKWNPRNLNKNDQTIWSRTEDREQEQLIGVPDLIYSILPKAKIIVAIREPVDRALSSYEFFQRSKDSFSDDVDNSMRMWRDCLNRVDYSHITCAYNRTLQKNMPVRLYNGLYSVYLSDWLRVFPKDQVLVIRTEDMDDNLTGTMDQIFKFLDLRRPNRQEAAKILNLPVRNKNKKKKNNSMSERTRLRLKQFYDYYNEQLYLMLGEKYRWNYD